MDAHPMHHADLKINPNNTSTPNKVCFDHETFLTHIHSFPDIDNPAERNGTFVNGDGETNSTNHKIQSNT
jgi:hypothetical protein